MSILLLALGLLLPWALGCALLSLPRCEPSAGARARLIGRGFFLGYGVLHLLLVSGGVLGLALPALSSYTSAAMLLALLSIGAWRVRQRRSARAATPRAEVGASTGYTAPYGKLAARGMLVLLLCWSALHLLLSLIELSHIPVFPWDAWLNWMYRAKAWFLSGEVAAFAAPEDWLRGDLSAHWNVAGHDYPTLVSHIALWVALLLGTWSETLINLPVFGAGLALALGMYGESRGLGASRLASAVAAYMLLSLPLLGTHLSLGGQADVWMSGYAGLGMAALLSGLIRSRAGIGAGKAACKKITGTDSLATGHAQGMRSVVAGLLLLLISLCCKREGLIWLTLGLALLAATYRPRTVAALLLTAAVVAALALLAGGLVIPMPGLGPLGVEPGRLYLGPLGEHTLQPMAVGDAYLRYFLLSGSWHLLWPLLLLAVISIALNRSGQPRRVGLLFALLFTASQVFLFGFTEQGVWAMDGTAINRVPLQLAPALILLLLLAVPLATSQAAALASTRDPLLASAQGTPLALSASGLTSPLAGRSTTGDTPAQPWGGQRTLVVLAGSAGTAAIVVLGLVLLFLRWGHPAADHLPAARMLAAGDLGLRVGGGYLRGGELVLNRFEQRIAVASALNVSLPADTLNQLRLRSAGDNTQPVEFFWRRAGDRGGPYAISIPTRGDYRAHLGAHPQWHGTISEIGLLAYEQAGATLRIQGLELGPPTLPRLLPQLRQDWLSPSRWAQRSVNHQPAGAEPPLLPLPPLLLAFSLLCAALALWGLRTQPAAVRHSAILASLLLGWLLLDLRWTANRLGQAADTVGTYPLFAAQALQFNDDQSVTAAVEAARARLPGGSTRLLITAPDPTQKARQFAMLRAKYHALPLGALVHEGPLHTLPAQVANHLLVLLPAYRDPSQVEPPAQWAGQLSTQLQRPVRVLWQSDTAFLLELGATP